CKIHIEVETGMQRTGLRLESAEKLIEQIQTSTHFHIVGIYSHLATADNLNNPFAHQQINLFRDFVTNIKNKFNINFISHIANSGGVCYFKEAHLDMVRPSLLAFGYFTKQKANELSQIAPFFSLKAKVSFFKVVSEKSGISYNHT